MKIIKQKLQELKDINMKIHCSTLECCDNKALLNFSPNQALKMCGLQKTRQHRIFMTNQLLAVTE